MPSPCPCRGCTAAYKAGIDEGTSTLREARRQAYTAGFNDAHRASELGHIIYGFPRTTRSTGYDPAATDNRP